ncbi:MAG: PAS domain-containing protein, partial [Pontiella sp.]|nr:PAS domain-containing protein [Pontiella sp.]
MKTMPPCILYSRDERLVDRLMRISTSVITPQPIESQSDLEQWLNQFGDTLLLADLRAPNCLDILFEIRKSKPGTLIIAMGADRSDPMLTAQWLEPFATLPLDPDRCEFQSLLKQASECFALRQRNLVLESELNSLKVREPQPQPELQQRVLAPLQNFSKAQRNFDNLDMLFESVVEGLVATARVSRAGIFIKPDAGDHFVFQAGTRCLSATEKLAIRPDSDFVRWLEMNTHLVSRRTLEKVFDPELRAMLKQMLDAFGAEIIIPLYAKGSIKGWIFVGQRSTGIPFEIADLEELTALADHISTTLEKALQYEETALQKALAETVLHSIPFGIIACDEHAIIRWFNSTAREILQPAEKTVIGQRAEALGSRVADLLRRTIDSQKSHNTREWTDNRTHITISAETHCLMDGNVCVGAMMVLRDRTGAKLLEEKEEQLERAAFWNELASSMSHEIRNPLVAIKTFSQLLPKRYEDADFRSEFSEQVTA